MASNTTRKGAFLLAVAASAAPAGAQGTWTAVSASPPGDNGLDTSILLTDGSILYHSTVPGPDNSAPTGWYKLTPSPSGGYVDGTWTTAASMNNGREYFESEVLPNGSLFVSGGEYTTNNDTSSYSYGMEIYNPVANTWTVGPNAPAGATLDDTGSKLLANGSGVLVGDLFTSSTYLYNWSSNTWSNGPNKRNNDGSDEESWVLLPDGSILTVNVNGSTAKATQRYSPVTNTWLNSGSTPSELIDSLGEIGPAVLLDNGKALFIGANGRTGLYTPPAAGSTATGSWANGPTVPNGLSLDDAPAAVETNGNVLFAAGNGYNSGTTLFEYNPTSNTMSAALSVPSDLASILSNSPPYTTRMLDLPTGQILFNSYYGPAYIYTPDGTVLASAKPAIAGITANTDGSYRLTGTQLNGIDEGSAYGDDVSNSTNYPLVQLVDSSGNVYYARTFDFSTMGVATGSTSVYTDFTLPANLPPGDYQLDVEANGIPSASVDFNTETMASDTSWNVAGGGNWGTGTNWTNSVIPQKQLDTAYFTSAITAASIVDLNSNWTVGNINFDNSNSYTIAPGTGGTLTLSNGTAAANVTDSMGTHMISAPLILISNVTFTVTNSTDALEVSGPITGAGGVTVMGAGTLSLTGSNSYSGATTVNSGTLAIGDSSAMPSGASVTVGSGNSTGVMRLANGTGVITLSTLSVNSGSTVDIGNNALVIQYGTGADPAAQIRSLIVSGYNSVGGAAGNWQGTGLTSSAAAANPASFAVGYADGDIPADAANTGVPAGTVEIKYTVAGDANLSGGVDLSDLVIVASDFGESGVDWAAGDVNYDGNVDLSDLVIVASNFGASLASMQTVDFDGSFAAEWQLAIAEVHGADVQVPEPVCCAAVAGAGLLLRRRKPPSRRPQLHRKIVFFD
jgi:autotransporter-associated beta strand protein